MSRSPLFPRPPVSRDSPLCRDPPVRGSSPPPSLGSAPDSPRARSGRAPSTITVGASREARAVDYLEARGFRIVERNFRCKLGELDIVARDGATLVFVEVRSRATAAFGSALEAVTASKRRRVTRMAMQYIAHRRPPFERARFDVVAITGDELVHVRDAWRP